MCSTQSTIWNSETYNQHIYPDDGLSERYVREPVYETIGHFREVVLIHIKPVSLKNVNQASSPNKIPQSIEEKP